MNQLLSPIFARITKVDEVTRTVTGRATQEMVDRDKEVFDYQTSKPNFQRWSAEVFADTGGKSLGNVRAMHGSVAAGILTDIDFNDHERAIDISAHITDDQEWRKVTSGTYSGFSIGGKYTKKWPDVMSGIMVNRYTADPAEISIVDRPCVPAAKFFTVHKADGSDIEVAFAPSLVLPTEGSAKDGAVTAGLDLLVKHGIKRVELVKHESKDGVGVTDDAVAKASAPAAGEANAMDATGAAMASSNDAISTNDVDLHETAAAAHATAAQAQLALGNRALATHHINAAKAHIDWQDGKSAKVHAPAAQGMSLH